MNYGIYFSNEMQKMAFPWSEVIGGGVGAGLGAMAGAGLGGAGMVVAPLVGAGLGALTGYGIRKSRENDRRLAAIRAEEDALINAYLARNPNGFVKPDYSRADAAMKRGLITGGLIGAGLYGSLGNGTRDALAGGALHGGLGAEEAYQEEIARADQLARAQMLAAARGMK